jgi:hypothetical protein
VPHFLLRDGIWLSKYRARTPLDAIHRRLDDPPVDDLDPREAERIRRRDHEADAEQRNLMKPGMGKVFKQIQDSWVRPPKKPSKPRRATRG